MTAGSLQGGPCPPALRLSFFPDVFDQRPRPCSVSWPRLVARLQQFAAHPGRVDKRTLPCWSPASFQPEQPATSEHTLALSCLVLDMDEGADLEACWAQTAPWQAALHTSWSHTLDAPRFRLVFPLARPIPAASWAAVWRAAVALLRLDADRKCVNANRRYLLPARPDAEAAFQFRSREIGPALDLAPLLPAAVAAHPRQPARRVVVPHYLYSHATRKRLSVSPEARERLAERLGATIRGSGRGQRAEGIPCPGCGRSSVWFLLAPEQATRARCNHLNSCGWSGPVTDLLGSAA
jgi:hypothetical protein